MATTKFASDDLMDAGLAWLKANGPTMYVCTEAILTADVPNYTKITTTAALTGPITTGLAAVALADGDTSGRKLTVPQMADITVTATGDVERVCLVNATGSVVAYVTTCTLQPLTLNNTVTIPAFDVELRDPA